MKTSARNQFPGKVVALKQGAVSRVQPGAVNTEVIIALPGGGTVAAIVTNQSSTALGLAVGQPASAIFKASSVIIGVPA